MGMAGSLHVPSRETHIERQLCFSAPGPAECLHMHMMPGQGDTDIPPAAFCAIYKTVGACTCITVGASAMAGGPAA